jgi:hypothetical protein
VGGYATNVLLIVLAYNGLGMQPCCTRHMARQLSMVTAWVQPSRCDGGLLQQQLCTCVITNL